MEYYNFINEFFTFSVCNILRLKEFVKCVIFQIFYYYVFLFSRTLNLLLIAFHLKYYKRIIILGSLHIYPVNRKYLEKDYIHLFDHRLKFWMDKNANL